MGQDNPIGELFEQFKADFDEISSRPLYAGKYGDQLQLFHQFGYLLGEAEASTDLGSVELQFAEFSRYGSSAEAGGNLADAMARMLTASFFSGWLRTSENVFAVAYRAGRADAQREVAESRVRHAVNGRRLIGSTSREKIRQAAQNFRHKTKSEAAPLIAEKVNQSPERVRTVLSELFPGKDWKL